MREIDEITASGYIETKGGLFKIDGVKVASPTSIEYEEHTLSRAWNSASGVQHKTNYRIRRKVVWKYSIIGRESFNVIYNILNNKRINTGSTRFDIHTEWFTGGIDMNVEWGTPFKPKTVDSIRDLLTVDISFIEPEGTELPTDEQLGG